MRIKVCDMFSDGELECLAHMRDGDDWIRVSRYNLCRAAGLDIYAPDEEVKAKLYGKEFDITPIVSSYIASMPKLAEENRWTKHDVECYWCGMTYCLCGDLYKPIKEIT